MIVADIDSSVFRRLRSALTFECSPIRPNVACFRTRPPPPPPPALRQAGSGLDLQGQTSMEDGRERDRTKLWPLTSRGRRRVGSPIADSLAPSDFYPTASARRPNPEIDARSRSDFPERIPNRVSRKASGLMHPLAVGLPWRPGRRERVDKSNKLLPLYAESFPQRVVSHAAMSPSSAPRAPDDSRPLFARSNPVRKRTGATTTPPPPASSYLSP